MKLKAAEKADTECHYCNEIAVVHSDDTCDGCGKTVSMCERHHQANVLLNTLDQVFNSVVEDLRKPQDQKVNGPRAVLIQAGLAGIQLDEVSLSEFDALQREQQAKGQTKH